MQTAIEEKIGAISHRSKQFQEIYKFTTDQLRTLMQVPADYEIFYLASATEIWERIIENCVEHTSFHCVNGSFSKRFYEFSGELGRKAYKEEAAFGEGFYPDKINVPADAEAVCLTHNETSSGVSMPVSDINKFREKNPNALIFVDAVSSAPYPSFDWTKIDSTFLSVQKCMGLPAGLGVWFLNKRVVEKGLELQKKGLKTGTYHTIASLLDKAKDNQTPETCNVLFIYLLGKVAEDMNKKGAATIRKETDEKAKLVYDYISNSKVFSPAVKDEALRSATTIVANTSISSAEVNKKLEAYNMAVGAGYSKYKDTQIRIANFPTHSVEQMKALVEALKKEFN